MLKFLVKILEFGIRFVQLFVMFQNRSVGSRLSAVAGVRDLCQGSAQLPREGVVQLDQEDPQFLGKNLASVV
jgi:hypothetical protein